MALIRCPECGKEISDKAAMCVYCGYPLEKKTANKHQPNHPKKNAMGEKIKIFFKGGLIFVLVIIPIALFFTYCSQWRSGALDGTFLGDIFPAVFFGIVFFWLYFLMASNIFKYNTVMWFVVGGIVGIAAGCFVHFSITSGIITLLIVFAVFMVIWLFAGMINK